MSKRHTWRIKRQYFKQLETGQKKFEIRVGYTNIKQVEKGDTIHFENYEENEFNVIDIMVFKSFSQMLEKLDVSKVLPGFSKNDAIRTLQSIYPMSKERLGVYVFELAITSQNPKLLRALEVAQSNRKLFSQIVSESYNLTDWICDDYPQHFNWFYVKVLPEIFSGRREIISCYFKNHIAGIAILKCDATERKICTLYVSKEFRDQGIGTLLMNESFKWLETTKPLISIADCKVKMFEKIIKNFDWQLTQVLDVGYYNDHSKEFVYNGEIK
jgi:ASC-1-like (ASCH) protein/GNAT superfamily N-acetyltransferase